MRELESTGNSTVLRRLDRRRVAGETGGCDRCRPHGGENAWRSRHPRSDRYKSRRKGR